MQVFIVRRVGFKATLSSKLQSPSWSGSLICQFLKFTDPNTSVEAKQHALEVLRSAGLETSEYSQGQDQDQDNSEHMHRVLGGYKATLHSKY